MDPSHEKLICAKEAGKRSGAMEESKKATSLFPSFASINIHELQERLKSRLAKEDLRNKFSEAIQQARDNRYSLTVSAEGTMKQRSLQELEQQVLTTKGAEIQMEVEASHHQGVADLVNSGRKETNNMIEGAGVKVRSDAMEIESEILGNVNQNLSGVETQLQTYQKEMNSIAQKEICMNDENEVLASVSDCNRTKEIASIVMGDHSVNNDCGEEDLCSDDEEIVPKEKEYIFPSPEEVENSIEPSVGMKFASLGEAHRYLNVHGLLNGYSTRKGTNYLKKTYHLECNRSGKGKKIDNAQRKRRRNYIERTGCKMKVTAKLIDRQWEFTKVDYEHNHETVKSPSLTKFFLNHKRMTEDERTFSKILQSARIKPKRIMAIFRELKGSFKQVNFNAKNLDNLQQKERRKK